MHEFWFSLYVLAYVLTAFLANWLGIFLSNQPFGILSGVLSGTASDIFFTFLAFSLQCVFGPFFQHSLDPSFVRPSLTNLLALLLVCFVAHVLLFFLAYFLKILHWSSRG